MLIMLYNYIRNNKDLIILIMLFIMFSVVFMPCSLLCKWFVAGVVDAAWWSPCRAGRYREDRDSEGSRQGSRSAVCRHQLWRGHGL